jgi:hypothetical protein
VLVRRTGTVLTVACGLDLVKSAVSRVQDLKAVIALTALRMHRQTPMVYAYAMIYGRDIRAQSMLESAHIHALDVMDLLQRNVTDVFAMR